MPDFEKLSSFYPTDYHSKVSGGLLKRVRNALRFADLRSLLKRDGAILDYGSGDGDFLVWLSERLPGRELYGYEIGETRMIEHRAAGAVTLIKGDPAYAADVIPRCSLITLNHVIEHLPDPKSTIQLLKEKLAPRGVFAGQTPAARSLEHRVFGTRWSGYHAPRHTVVFSHAGLETFLRDLGFQDIKVSGGFNPAGLAVSVASVMDRGLQGGIVRSGAKWMACLGAAAILAPIDFLSGSPGIVNFQGSQPL
jgi:SAM-dependent methyltransferase